MKKLQELIADSSILSIDDILETGVHIASTVPETVEELTELMTISEMGMAGKIVRMRIDKMPADIKSAKNFIDPKAFIYI